MNLSNITSKDLARIAKLLKKKETLLEKVAKVESQLATFESGKPAAVGVAGKRNMSTAGRAAIAAAQKARWAKLKGKKAGKRKHKMSAAGRAAIVAAQKARWAKIKAQKA
jgi:hypothetical protein